MSTTLVVEGPTPRQKQHIDHVFYYSYYSSFIIPLFFHLVASKIFSFSLVCFIHLSSLSCPHFICFSYLLHFSCEKNICLNITYKYISRRLRGSQAIPINTWGGYPTSDAFSFRVGFGIASVTQEIVRGR